MQESQDIVLVVDYHARNIEFRWFDRRTGEERTGKFATNRSGILRLAEQAAGELPPGGQVVWVMESTTGWARVKELLGSRAEFVLANVLQMPLPPKGRRRKTDKIDTARILREYLNGSLPRSFQPTAWWRQVRRLVDTRQDLVGRQTAIKNWITSLLHHETWENRENLWSGKGLRRLRAMELPAGDRLLVDLRIVVARLLLRSLHKMLRDQVRFNPDGPRVAAGNQNDRASEATGGPARKGERDSAFIALGPTSGRNRKAKGRDSRSQLAKGPGLEEPIGQGPGTCPGPCRCIGTGAALGSLASVALSSAPVRTE